MVSNEKMKAKKSRKNTLAELKAIYGDKVNCLDLCQDPERHNRYIKMLNLDNSVYNDPKKINL